MVFKKGESGNPGGRRKERIITDALKVELMHAHDENYSLPSGATNLQAMARKMVEKAVSGDSQMAKEITDRIEGKAEASVSVEHSGSVTHEHEAVPATLGWLGDIRRKDETGETTKPVLN